MNNNLKKDDLINLATEALSKKAVSSFFNVMPIDLPDEMDIAANNNCVSLIEAVFNKFDDERIKPFLKSATLSNKQVALLFTFLKNKENQQQECVQNLIIKLAKESNV